MKVDAHQHFWQLARGDYAWLQGEDAALAPLRRDFGPAELASELQATGITHTVLVQAADSTAETDFLLALAAAPGVVAGVVGWADIARPDSVAHIERWAAQPAFKGLRPMLQDLPQDDWIQHAPHPEVMHAMLRCGLRFDALVLPRHLGPLRHFAARWPALPIVIDHAAKPPLAGGPHTEAWAAWRRDMAALAALPQVCCKVSGWATLLPPGLAPAAALAVMQPLWDELLALFGPARLMWGSDWPVLTLASGYAGWHSLARQLAAPLSADEAAHFWGGTAARYYALT